MGDPVLGPSLHFHEEPIVKRGAPSLPTSDKFYAQPQQEGSTGLVQAQVMAPMWSSQPGNHAWDLGTRSPLDNLLGPQDSSGFGDCNSWFPCGNS